MPYKNKKLQKEYNKQYHAKHSWKLNEYSRQYYKDNKEKLLLHNREYNKQYRLQNREKLRERSRINMREYRIKHPNYDREYRITHRHQCRVRYKRYYYKNIDRCRTFALTWRHNNIEKAHEMNRTYERNLRHTLYTILTPEGQIPKCMDCGEMDYELIELHHIYADGKEDRDKYGHSTEWIKHYIKDPIRAKQRLRLLCYKCHKRLRKQTTKTRYWIRMQKKAVLVQENPTSNLTLLAYMG